MPTRKAFFAQIVFQNIPSRFFLHAGSDFSLVFEVNNLFLVFWRSWKRCIDRRFIVPTYSLHILEQRTWEDKTFANFLKLVRYRSRVLKINLHFPCIGISDFKIFLEFPQICDMDSVWLCAFPNRRPLRFRRQFDLGIDSSNVPQSSRFTGRYFWITRAWFIRAVCPFEIITINSMISRNILPDKAAFSFGRP